MKKKYLKIVHQLYLILVCIHFFMNNVQRHMLMQCLFMLLFAVSIQSQLFYVSNTAVVNYIVYSCIALTRPARFRRELNSQRC